MLDVKKLKYVLLSMCITFLLGCMSDKELLAYLHGSWEGRSEDSAWCVLYTADGEYGLASLYIKAFTEDDNDVYEISHQAGYVAVSHGGRFRHIVGYTHTEAGQFVPEPERNSIKSRYLISDYSDGFFQYQSSASGTQYVNRRVENCDEYAKQYKERLAEIEVNFGKAALQTNNSKGS